MKISHLFGVVSTCLLAFSGLQSSAFAQDFIDIDIDKDGIFADDNCPFNFNPNQEDDDLDGVGNVCDNCPNVHNPQQADTDLNGIGDTCEGGGIAENLQLTILTEPLHPVPDKTFEINVEAFDPKGIKLIEIYINRNLMKKCFNINLCKYTMPELGENVDFQLGARGVNNDYDFNFIGEIPEEAMALPPVLLEDDDGDGVVNLFDNCRFEENTMQFDHDQDNVGNVCDQCDAFEVCGFTPHVPVSPEYFCGELSSRAHPLVQDDVYYYQRLYSKISSNGCGCLDTDDVPFGVSLAEQSYFKGRILREEDAFLILSGGPFGEACRSSSNCAFANEDSCYGSGRVKEYHCTPTGTSFSLVDCAHGCYRGACDRDDDGDGRVNRLDNCPFTANPDQANRDSDRYGDLCDNCPDIPNSDQDDGDGDGDGDVCDNCPETANGGQENNDGDSLGNACDNCPNNVNEDQNDWNADGTGNECDCDDNFRGLNETGADCGGICGGTCASCVPLIINGDPRDKIDVVFVRDNDYLGNSTAFLNDVDALIEGGYFGATEFFDNRCKFNFYYHRRAGDYQGICEQWRVPRNFDSDCSFADTTAIIFTGGDRACSNGGNNRFSTRSGDLKTVVHESGHNIFNSADEYCCDGGYGQPDGPFPNVFRSEEECLRLTLNSSCENFCPEEVCTWPDEATCRAWATANDVNPDDCDGMCSPNWGTYRGRDEDGDGNPDFQKVCEDGGDGWWKGDADTCYLLSGTTFEPDDSARVLERFSRITACINPGSPLATSASLAISSVENLQVAEDNPAQRKVIILNLNITGDVVTLRNSKIAFNTAPNHFADHGEYSVKSFSLDGTVLASIFVHNPKEFAIADHMEGEQGIIMGDNVDFTVILELNAQMRMIEVVDNQSTQTLLTIDLADTLRDFCANGNEVDELCQNLDLDNDGVPDQNDGCLNSNMDNMVNINNCKSTARNELLEDGCSMNDQLHACFGKQDRSKADEKEAKKCAINVAQNWKNGSLISGREQGRLLQCINKP